MAKKATKEHIKDYKKRESRCKSCKQRKRHFRKMMNPKNTKRQTLKHIRKYHKAFLRCDQCLDSRV